MKALIFNCDGTIVDTERDGHRVAFNETFTQFGMNINWSIDLYGNLLKIAGGKERLRYYFDIYGWPAGKHNNEKLIKDLHKRKTDNYVNIIKEGKLPLRSGVLRLIDEAINEKISIAICSASNEKAVNLLIDTMIGKERKKRIKGIFAGDMVSMKKPDSEIYNLASNELKVEPKECVVIEDSRIGLLAATGAGMRCVITKSSYTGDEDFAEANAVFSELGDPPSVQVTLKSLRELNNY
jgi:HAD superfamily hydrolase (TIGR01509 family)